MKVFFRTSISPKKKKGYYRDIDMKPLIYSLSKAVEIKNGVHYLGTSILTSKEMIDIVDSYLCNIALPDYDLIYRNQKSKISSKIFDELRKEE